MTTTSTTSTPTTAVKSVPAKPAEKAAPKKPRVTTDSAKNQARVRFPVRLHPDTKTRVEYWAQKHDLSANDYAAEAIEAAIRRENQDYDLPTLELQRLNQMIDEVKSLSSNQQNLEAVIRSGFDSILGLVRGDNYLLDPEDGELTNG